MMKRILFFMLLLPLSLTAQKITPEEYIETYKDIAMKEMKKHKIPASITLAQGLLESGAGNSELARKAKNHFGIKCHKEWNGRTFRMDDDAKNECFRRYRKAEDSYRDHSEFLTTRSRYADLFKLNIMDYKAWAHGLKAAGYATNPSYANLLITRIETYKLYLYDQLAMGKISEREFKKRMGESGATPPVIDEPWLAYSPVSVSSFELVDMTKNERFIYENNHVRFVFAKEGETPKSLAKEMRICKKRLCSYNLIKDPDEVVFHSGDVVYLQPLRNKNRKEKSYTVDGGETVRDVALRFAVKPERILKMNKLTEDARLQRGQQLKLK
jgi:LysM repeat protein